jgi:hypothetical protein
LPACAASGGQDGEDDDARDAFESDTDEPAAGSGPSAAKSGSDRKRAGGENKGLTFFKRQEMEKRRVQETAAGFLLRLDKAVKNAPDFLSFDVSGARVLTSDHWTSLSRALTTNTTITAVNLSGNALYLAGLTPLSAMLNVNRSITSLSLASTFQSSMGDEECRALGDALARNDVLTALDLSGNKIGPMGIRGLVAGLQRNPNPTLRSLILADNQLKGEGVQIIGRGFTDAPSVRTCDRPRALHSLLRCLDCDLG